MHQTTQFTVFLTENLLIVLLSEKMKVIKSQARLTALGPDISIKVQLAAKYP